MKNTFRYNLHHERRASGPFTLRDHRHTTLAYTSIEPKRGTTVANVFNDELAVLYKHAPKLLQVADRATEGHIDNLMALQELVEKIRAEMEAYPA